ncbi:MAG TPA: nucleoside hydrolase [Eubacteriales bacterium]|nr:nucleoside hydrolase [Clostridia bacterium]HRV73315.1 nucleoside hydrolase [Eubacteriales bacterium]
MRDIWIDCDVGVDDAICLMTAAAMPDFHILGVSCVAGNVELYKTYENTRRVMDFISCAAPVYKGADKPLLRELVTAPYIHGNNGIGDVVLPESTREHESKTAWDALYETAVSCNGSLELIAVGPLTNIAIALSKYSKLASLLKSITIMGGACSFGNRTPAAEFNFYVDPEAAQLVMKCGAPITMVGLDVTNKAELFDYEVELINRVNTPKGRFFIDSRRIAMAYLKENGHEGTELHDPCAVVCCAHPELFTMEEAGVYVETRSELTRGKSVTDVYSDFGFEHKNAKVVLDLDREAFAKIMISLLTRR